MCHIKHSKHNVCQHVDSHEKLCKFGDRSPPRTPKTRKPLKKLRHHFVVSIKECHVTQSSTQEYSLCHDCRRTWEKHGVPEWKSQEIYQEYRRKNQYWGVLAPVVVPKKEGKGGEECILVPEPGRPIGDTDTGQILFRPPSGDLRELPQAEHLSPISQAIFAPGAPLGPLEVRGRCSEPLGPLTPHSVLKTSAVLPMTTGSSLSRSRQQWPLFNTPSQLQTPSVFSPPTPGLSVPSVSSLRTRDRKPVPTQHQQVQAYDALEDVNLEDSPDPETRSSVATLWPGGERELREMQPRNNKGNPDLVSHMEETKAEAGWNSFNPPKDDEDEDEDEDDEHPCRKYRIYPKWI